MAKFIYQRTQDQEMGKYLPLFLLPVFFFFFKTCPARPINPACMTVCQRGREMNSDRIAATTINQKYAHQ